MTQEGRKYNVKRYTVTLPLGLAQCLENWAAAEGNKPTSLANYLIEKAVRDAVDQGKVKPPSLEPDKDLEKSDRAALFVLALTGKKKIDVWALQKLADELQLPSEVLAEILKNCSVKNRSKTNVKNS